MCLCVYEGRELCLCCRTLLYSFGEGLGHLGGCLSALGYALVWGHWGVAGASVAGGGGISSSSSCRVVGAVGRCDGVGCPCNLCWARLCSVYCMICVSSRTVHTCTVQCSRPPFCHAHCPLIPCGTHAFATAFTNPQCTLAQSAMHACQAVLSPLQTASPPPPPSTPSTPRMWGALTHVHHNSCMQM